MAASEFFESDTPHGLVKRFMYKRYLQAYIPKTQKYYKTVIMDGFAGKGRYSEDWPTEIEKYGSPVIAVRVAVEFLGEDMKFSQDIVITERFIANLEKGEAISVNLDGIESRIILIFVEKDERNFTHLLSNVQKTFILYGLKFDLRLARNHIHITVNDQNVSIHCKLYHASFEQVNPPVWPEQERNTRYLTFIDPFGYSQTPMSHVSNFVGKHREVFINFMSSYVNRFLSQTPRRILELYRIYNPYSMDDQNKQLAEYVKALVRKGEQDCLDNCVSNYVAALKERLPDGYDLEFEMRGIQNVRKFHLVYVTDHIEGLKTMKESMVCGTQEQSCFGLSDYKILKKGKTISLTNIQDNRLVADEIYSRFKNQSNVPIDDVKQYILIDTPFVFRKEALKILEIERMVLTVSSATNEHRKQGTYPDRENWLLSFRPST